MFCHRQLLGDGGGEKDRPKYHQVNMSYILELKETLMEMPTDYEIYQQL